MAVEVTQNWSGTTGDDNGGILVFMVTGVQYETQALLATDETGRGTRVPQKNDQHPRRQEWLCENRSASQVGPVTWVVTSTFTSPTSGSSHPTEQDPLSEPADIISRTGTISDVLEFDVEGNAIVNTAFDPYPGLTDERNV